MTLPTDPVQQLSEAIATILDTNASIVALTGRESGNVARWKRRKPLSLPRLAYHVGPAEIAGGLGETYDVDATLRAEAATPAAANALLRAAIEALTPMAFEALGCDALITEWTPDCLPDDESDPSSNAALVIAESDLVVNLTL